MSLTELGVGNRPAVVALLTAPALLTILWASMRNLDIIFLDTSRRAKKGSEKLLTDRMIYYFICKICYLKIGFDIWFCFQLLVLSSELVGNCLPKIGSSVSEFISYVNIVHI